MSVELLLDRIGRVRARERVVLVTAGVFKTVLALLAMAAGFFVLDWFIVSRVVESAGADRAARVVLALAMAGTLVYVFWQTVLGPLLYGLDDDEIALRVEKRHPDLRGRLISTIQLTREVGVDPFVGSLELIRALEEDTVSFASALDFFEIISLKTLKKVGIAATAFTALAFAAGVLSPGHFRALLRRLLLTGAEYPTATRILSVTPGGAVPLGESYPVEIRLDAGLYLPETATLLARPTGGGRAIKHPLVRDDTVSDEVTGVDRNNAAGVLYRGAGESRPIERVMEDLRYRAIAYDARSGWEDLRVLRRPAIRSLELSYTYPEYSRQPPHVSNVGDIRALVGTTVKISAALTKPVSSARLSLRYGAEILPPVEMNLRAERTAAAATLRLAADGYYKITLRDADDLEDPNPIEYRIDAVDDRAPVVKITFPARDRSVTPIARWPIRFEARDDWGLGRGWLRYRVISEASLVSSGSNGAESGAPGSGDEVAEGEVKGVALRGLVRRPGRGEVRKEVKDAIVFDLQALKPEVGSRIVYWIEVEDAKSPRPGTGRSKRYEFSVVSVEEMTEMMDVVRQDALSRIEVILRREIKSKEGVDEIRTRLRPNGSRMKDE